MNKVKGNQFIMPTYYRNEYLFSEIYLEEITQIPEQAEVLASLNTLKEYRDYADTSSLQAWKDSFVHQVLYALGFNIQAESENVTQLFPMGSVKHPISVCYILLPGENLDNTTMGRNWAEKIIRSLREHELQWGLLTNGEQWRIYHRDEPTPYETYLEIDLSAILADKAREAYQIFHKFMRAENFTSGEDEQCQFDVFKQESQDKIDYIEKELENALKQKEEGGQGVLSSLCMGYVEYLRQNGDPDLEDEELRRKIYHGAMLYMFRLLFLYYADARGLLSDDNRQLLAEVRQAAYERSHSGDASEKSYRLWQDLETIFVDIDQTYNGGLFNPHESEFTLFVEESKIADTFLTPSIYHLAYYREGTDSEKLISYRDMGVRHLGTLYEGLLEHKLFIANEDIEVKIYKNNIQFIPSSEGGRIVAGKFIPKGNVYFGTDSSERRTSGSYYTPEAIVNYIVRETVYKRLAELRQQLSETIQPYLESYERAINIREKSSLINLISETIVSFINAKVLNLSVVDPAMGSGHFLVNTTNQISNFITSSLNELGINSEIETAPHIWRRKVVENCVYGVDINSLAVELAKLSLWILSMAKERPLSFLNHHLKVGNSLVGARLKDIGVYPGTADINSNDNQFILFSDNQKFKVAVDKAIEKYNQIASIESLSVKDIKEKKILLDEAEQLLNEFKKICDLHIGIRFGLSIDEWDYQKIVSLEANVDNRLLQKTNYFHWELEYPSVFARGGFDIVIGNPPWVSFGLRGVGTLDELEETYYRVIYANSAEYKLSLYAIFMEAAIRLLNDGGRHSFIVPDSFLLGQYFSKIRRFILDTSGVEKIVLFLEDFWPSASIGRCVIYVIRREKTRDDRINSIIESIEAKTLPDFEKNITKGIRFQQSDYENLHLNRFRLYFDEYSRSIVEKMEANSIPLSNVVKFYSGLIGKKGKASIVVLEKPADYSPESYGKLISSGKYLSRYHVEFGGEYIRRDKGLYKSGYDEKKYLSPKLFLNQTGDSLKPCYDDRGYFCLNNMHIGYPVSDLYDLRFINALLASRLMNFYYHAISLELGRAMAQIDIETLDLLPLPKDIHGSKVMEKIKPSEKFLELYEKFVRTGSGNVGDDIHAACVELGIHNAIVFLANQMLILKSTNKTQDQSIHKQISATDKIIDNLIYRIYKLTSEEIDFLETQEV